MDSRKGRKVAAVALMALAGLGVRSASAAGMGMSPQEIFIGGSAAEQCNPGEVAVDYDVAYDATLGGYGIAAAQLSGLDEQCEGFEITVSLNGPGGATLAEMTTAVSGSTMRVEVPAASPVAAEQLTGVSVVLRSVEV